MNVRSNRAERRLGTYYRITSDPGLSLDAKIQKLLRFARGSLRMPIAVVAQVTDQRFDVIHAVPSRGAIAAGTMLDLAHTYCAETIASPHPVAFSQASGSAREQTECFRRCQMEAYLGMRIVVAGQPWGTLALLSEIPRSADFNDGDLHFIRLLSDWIGNALTWAAETQELRALAEWRKAVFSGISIGIVTCDPDGTMRELNPAAEHMFGYAADQLTGGNTRQLFDFGPLHRMFPVVAGELGTPSNIGSIARPLAEQLARDGRLHQVKALGRRNDGTRFPAQITVSTLFDKAGTVQAQILLIEDVTERLAQANSERQLQATELASTILRAVGDGMIGIDSTPPYRIRMVNAVGEKLLALPEHEALGRPLESFMNVVADGSSRLEDITALLATTEAPYCEVMLHVNGDGVFPASIGITRIDSSHVGGSGDLTVLTIRNIAYRKQTEERLRLSDKVFEHSAEAIVITDAEGTILNVNPAFTWITGYGPDEAVGNSPNILKSGRHPPTFYAEMWHALISSGHWEGEIWDRHKAGHLYPKWLTINAVKEDGLITHYVALFSDISARKEQEERIRFLAEHDQLTGLPNRHFLKHHFGLLKLSERRRDHCIALMMIDLDEFKLVNDTLGHAAGDELLVEVARRLVAAVRDSDIVVRLGGDEFVILLEDIGDRAHLDAIACKVHEAVRQPIELHGKTVSTSPSIGIALGPQDGNDVEALLRKADIAMYRVKVTGRNAWQFFVDGEPNTPAI